MFTTFLPDDAAEDAAMMTEENDLRINRTDRHRVKVGRLELGEFPTAGTRSGIAGGLSTLLSSVRAPG